VFSALFFQLSSLTILFNKFIALENQIVIKAAQEGRWQRTLKY